MVELAKFGRAALKLAAKGFAVFPCDPASKAPIPGLCMNGVYSATRWAPIIQQWWAFRPDAMIGAQMGPKSKLWALDLDLDPGKGLDGAAAFAALCAAQGGAGGGADGAAPETLSQSTPRGGRHLFFRWEAGRPVRNSAGKLAPGVDVRGDGGYVILAPSLCADGGGYRWAGPAQAAPAPAWLYDALSPPPAASSAPLSAQARACRPAAASGNRYAEAALTREAEAVRRAAKGRRNSTLNIAAFNLGQLVGGGLLEAGRVTGELTTAAQFCGLLGEDGAKAVAATIQCGLNAGRQQPRGGARPAASMQTA